MRILLLTHDFPPLNSSAARRPYSWAVAWAARGHDVHVVTTVKYRFDGHAGLNLPQAGFALTQVAYLPERYKLATESASNAGLSRSLDFVRRATRRLRLGLGLMTQTPMLARAALLHRCLEEHQRKPFDVIVSTSGPEVCTFVAHAFTKRTGVPWVADYRDLWFQEFAVQRYAFTTWLTGTLNTRMLRRAAAVVTVSKGLAGYLQAAVCCPVWVCYNGFIENSLAAAQPPWTDDRIHIVYTGNFYPQKRDPRPLFAGMAALFAEQPTARDRLRLDIYGPREEWVRAQVREFGLDDVVMEHGMVDHAESLRAQACADALLFIDWMDPAAKGVLTGKLFEYLSAGRPIINVSTNADSEASQVIRDANAGEPLTDFKAICGALQSLIAGNLRATVNQSAVARFSRRAQAEALLERIEELLRAKT